MTHGAYPPTPIAPLMSLEGLISLSAEAMCDGMERESSGRNEEIEEDEQ